MARAKRHFLPGHAWHITHRCHKKEFLLKLVKDRQRWLYWLFQAKKRYGLRILNYMVTSNHFLCEASHNACFPIIQMPKISTKYGAAYRLIKSSMKSFSISPNGNPLSTVLDIRTVEQQFYGVDLTVML